MNKTTLVWHCGCNAEAPSNIPEAISVIWDLHHCPLHAAAGELLEVCKAAIGSLTICQVPHLDERVASNEAIMGIVLKSLHAVVAHAEPKAEPRNGTSVQAIFGKAGTPGSDNPEAL